MKNEIINLTQSDLLKELRQKCDEAGSMLQWAAIHGVSKSQVSDILRGRREFSEVILNAMGLVRVQRYVRVGR